MNMQVQKETLEAFKTDLLILEHEIERITDQKMMEFTAQSNLGPHGRDMRPIPRCPEVDEKEMWYGIACNVCKKNIRQMYTKWQVYIEKTLFICTKNPTYCKVHPAALHPVFLMGLLSNTYYTRWPQVQEI